MLGEIIVHTDAVMSSRQEISFACHPGLSAACMLPVAVPLQSRTTPKIASALSYKPY